MKKHVGGMYLINGLELTSEIFDYTFQLNQAFVDVIPNSGGNNSKRHLLLAGYCTDAALTCEPMFKMPNDPANRCGVSIHYYTPSIHFAF